ncbi:MAG: hypothetical protein IJL69_05885 [Oscillospiraceae bacterium]|nr:hypothetical protein [Oscillospiraceae bacterium]
MPGKTAARWSGGETDRQAEKNDTNSAEALKREGLYQEGQPSGRTAGPEGLKKLYTARILSLDAGRRGYATAVTNAGYVSETVLDVGEKDFQIKEVKKRVVFTPGFQTAIICASAK